MLKSLHLKNFKCFKDNNFELKPLTILAGINGTGKSSLIQSLLAIRQSYQQGLLADGRLSLNGELVHLGLAKDVLFEDAREEIITINIEYLINNKMESSNWDFKYERDKNSIELITKPTPKLRKEISLFSQKFHYLGAERIGPRTSFDISDYDVLEQGQLGNSGEFSAHYLAVYGDNKLSINELCHHKATSNSLISQVEAWLSEISPGVRLHVEEHLSTFGMDLVSLRYSFQKKSKVTNQYRSTNVGFGLTYILPILVAILSSQKESLIIIENPEAHLHPRGQSKIGELLSLAANNGINIIVETHSDHILNGVRVATKNKKIKSDNISIYSFEFEKKDSQSSTKVTKININQKGIIDSWPAGFFDQIETDLSIL